MMPSTQSNRLVVHTLRKRKEIQNLSKAFTEQIPSTLGILVETSNIGNRTKLNFFQNSILDIVCFSLSRIVRIYPKINSRYQNEKSYLEIDCMDIGVAFDNGSNLKVLGIPDAAKLSLDGIQDRILEMLDLYESNETIHPKDFANTITVTDLTEMDIAFVVPTLSSEQSMILSINKHSKSDYLITCTYDHRIMEGYYVSEFLSALKAKILEVLKMESNLQEEISCTACQRTLSEEIELNSTYRGLIVLKNTNHSEVLLCRVCFEGW